ncbi:hypothetical protein HYY69_01515 [Candidatus Woesearchaeota archaeon]|nr:hypothetical protein [Candidatus Woesearchaeota archaeon]
MTRAILEQIVDGIKRHDKDSVLSGLNSVWTGSGQLAISNLDDITFDYLTNDVKRVLGLRTVHELRSVLIDAEVLSNDLAQYDPAEQERILAGVIAKRSHPKFESAYFDPELGETKLEENRRKLVKNPTFKKMLDASGIRCLDDIEKTTISYGLNKVLGIDSKGIQVTRFRERMVELGYFTYDLSDYADEDKEHVGEIVIRSFSTRKVSEYFSEERPESVLAKNRCIFLETSVFKKYIEQKNIKSLDDIETDTFEDGFSLVIGAKKRSVPAFMAALIDYGCLPSNIEDYSPENQDRIVAGIISSFNTAVHSYYLAHEVLSEAQREKNRAFLMKRKEFRAFLEVQGVICLDDITANVPAGSVSNQLNCKSYKQLRNKLAEVGYFNINLSGYDAEEREIIVRKILTQRLARTESSAYLDEDLEEKVKEDNRNAIIASQAFKDHLKEHRIMSLDNIRRHAHTYGSITYFIGETKPQKVKSKLIEAGTFSESLADYTPEDQEFITKQIIDNLEVGNTTSAYAVATLSPDILELNKKIILGSAAFKEFLKQHNVFSLDDIESRTFGKGLCALLGTTIGSSEKEKEALVRYGVFSYRLKEYASETQENICKQIVEDLEKSKQLSVYFSDERDAEIVDENRALFAQSKAFKEYRDKNGWKTLDHIQHPNLKRAITSIMGCVVSVNELRDILVKYGAYNYKLQEEEPSLLEAAACKIIESAKNRKDQNKSSYFNDDLDHEIIDDNQLAILGTRSAQEFLAEEGASLDDLTTLSFNARRFLTKIKVIDQIPSRKSDRRTRKASYRMIQKEWQPDEERALYALAESFREDTDALITEIRGNKTRYQEQLGVSVNAIYSKMERLGILPETNQANRTTADRSGIVYPFPQIHHDEYPGVLNLFRNVSVLLGKNSLPQYVPLVGYDSATHEQFHHATLPIRFKGIEINDYTSAEQEVIAVVNRYISDNSYWIRRANGDIEVPTLIELEDPRIIARHDAITDRTYVELVFRKRFNPNNLTDTVALIHGRTEYLHFKHDGEVTFERTN